MEFHLSPPCRETDVSKVDPNGSDIRKLESKGPEKSARFKRASFDGSAPEFECFMGPKDRCVPGGRFPIYLANKRHFFRNFDCFMA